MVADLARLVAIPSENPPCDNERIARHAAELLRRRTSADVRVERVSAGKFNVLARFGSPRVLWNAHLDTVPAGGEWTRPPHRLTREGSRLYGLGTCDTKGAFAALLSALSEVAPRRRADGRRPSPDLLVALTGDEEAGPGECVPALLRHPWRRGIQWGIVSEPTGGRVVTAHRAIYSIRVEFRGRTAHASRPERGRNAIDAAARFVTDLAVLRRRLARRSGAGFRGSILNVGTISGGIKTNMVADRCEVRIGRRTLPGERESTVVYEIAAVAREAARRFGCRAVSTCTFAGPGLSPGRSATPVAALRRAGAGPAVSVDFWSEAALFSRAGISSVVFGPGRIAQAHAPDEYVTLGSLARARDVYRAWLHSLDL